MAHLAAGHAASLDALMERHAQRLFHYLLRGQWVRSAGNLSEELRVHLILAEYEGQCDPQLLCQSD
jgi:hypothetical protein